MTKAEILNYCDQNNIDDFGIYVNEDDRMGDYFLFDKYSDDLFNLHRKFNWDFNYDEKGDYTYNNEKMTDEELKSYIEEQKYDICSLSDFLSFYDDDENFCWIDEESLNYFNK